MHSRGLILVLACFAAALNLVPLLLVVPSGDVIMNYMLVDCFSTQLWSGIFYPHWCVEANGGMGSPGPIFYFPLAYYATAIFGPLRWLGMNVEQHYLLGVYLANVVAFLSCYAWISRIASQRTALFIAFLFLWGFYRTELSTRASYAEYWCIALLPLLFMLVRESCRAPFAQWCKLTCVIALCFLAHAPATLIGLIGAGLLILLYGQHRLRALAELALATGLATAATLFHYLPMRLLLPTLNDGMGGTSHWQSSWVNSFADEPQIYIEHGWVLIGAGIGLVAFLFACASFIRKRALLPADAIREGMAWIGIATFAVFMIFSISAPLWKLIGMVSGVSTPWRIQALLMFALFALLALLSEHAWFRNARTRAGDFVLASMFFIFASLFYSGGVAQESVELHQRVARAQYVLLYYAPKEIDGRYRSVQAFFETFIDRENRQQAEWVRGSGALSIQQWNAKGIIVTGRAEKAGTLRLEHFYYPIWQARLNGQPATITPEPITGRMLFDVPQGDFSLTLTQGYIDMLRYMNAAR